LEQHEELGPVQRSVIGSAQGKCMIDEGNGRYTPSEALAKAKKK
jgi:hypothetical protein